MRQYHRFSTTIAAFVFVIILLPNTSFALPPELERYLGPDFTEVVYHTGDSLVLVNDTIEMCGVHVYDYVALQEASVLKVQAYDGTAPNGVLVLIAENILIGESSHIDGKGKGYRSRSGYYGEGPGGGENGFCCEAGISPASLLLCRQYGGAGGSHISYGENGDAPIGICHTPQRGSTYNTPGHGLMGSAGGGITTDILCDYFVDDEDGTHGGGAVLLFAANTIQMGTCTNPNLSIDCEGVSNVWDWGSSMGTTYGGGGSGGSVILNAPVIINGYSIRNLGGVTGGMFESLGGKGGYGATEMTFYQHLMTTCNHIGSNYVSMIDSVYIELKYDTGFDTNIPDSIYSFDTIYAKAKVSNDGRITTGCDVRLTISKNNTTFYSENIHIPILLPGDSSVIEFSEWVAPVLCENNELTAQIELLKPYWDIDTVTEVLTKDFSLLFKPYYQLPSDSLVLDSDTLLYYQPAYENLYVELRNNSLIRIDPSDYYEAGVGFEAPFFHIFIDSTSTIEMSGGGGLGGGKPQNPSGYNGDGRSGGLAPPDLSVCGSGGGGGYGGSGGTQSDISPFINGAGGSSIIEWGSGSGGASNDTSLLCDPEFNYGGDGGGTINLNSGSIIINGNLLVNGENGSGTISGSGGGAGGDIRLSAAIIDLTGANIQAIGGNGGAIGDGSGGGGGGGKISFYAGYIDSTNANISVNGGTCGSTGCNGGDGIISFTDMNIDAKVDSMPATNDTIPFGNYFTPAAFVNGIGYGCFPTFNVLCEIDSLGVTIYSDTVSGTGVGWDSDLLAIFEEWPASEVTLTTLYEIKYQTLLPGDDNPNNDIMFDSVIIMSPEGLDYDDDGIPDYLDNCPYIANDQTDTDGDNRGDFCDNCLNTENYDQIDTDGDGIGNACDNCVFAENTEQDDMDSDGVGDMCDNCASVWNEAQDNSDNDLWGDACDNCPNTENNDQDDIDEDGIGYACDDCVDSDGDGAGDPGIENNLCPDDNCPEVNNPDQLDSDYDGIGDICDNCPYVSNISQHCVLQPPDGPGDACTDFCGQSGSGMVLHCPLGEYPDYSPYGMPDIGIYREGWIKENITGDSLKDTHSGPAALADCLFWLDSKYQYEINPASPPPPEISDDFPLITSSGLYDDHDTMNVIDVVNTIAAGAGTDSLGTEIHDMFNYLESYLNGLGLNNVGVTRLIPFPDTLDILEAYINDDAVVLLLGLWNVNPNPIDTTYYRRIGGNYVALRYVRDDFQFVFSDPIVFDCNHNSNTCEESPFNVNLGQEREMPPIDYIHNDYVDFDNSHFGINTIRQAEYHLNELNIHDITTLLRMDLAIGQNCPDEFKHLQETTINEIYPLFTVVEYAMIISVAQNCDCIPGDANGNGSTNILDITHLIAYLYQSGGAPLPYTVCSGDPNCNCTVNILDITSLIAYLYQNGDAPCDCSSWKGNCGSLTK